MLEVMDRLSGVNCGQLGGTGSKATIQESGRGQGYSLLRLISGEEANVFTASPGVGNGH